MDIKTKIWKKSMNIAKVFCGCHQIPKRSFFIRGYQLPLCARCTGITIGYLISLLLCALQIVFPLSISLIMLIPLFVDGGLQLLFCIMSNNIRRFVSGLLFGVGFLNIGINIILFLMHI